MYYTQLKKKKKTKNRTIRDRHGYNVINRYAACGTKLEYTYSGEHVNNK